jgi:HEAT repeat protein
MLAYCPACWNTIRSSPATCRNCGARIDVYSHEYEQQLVSLLSHIHSARRAEICLVLGGRGKRSAVPQLVELLTDPSVLVRVAALRALKDIGDHSALPAIKKIANEHTSLGPVAQQVVDALEGDRSLR